MADSIIGVSLERDVRVLPLHPTVERIVKKKVSQYRADYRARRGPSFPADQGPVRHAHGCLEPSLNIQQHPFAVGVMAHGAIKSFQSIRSKKLSISRSSTQSRCQHRCRATAKA